MSRKLLDVFRSSPAIQAAAAETGRGSSYIRDVSVEAFLIDCGLRSLVPLIEDSSFSCVSVDEITDEMLTSLGITSQDVKVRLTESLRRFCDQLGESYKNAVLATLDPLSSEFVDLEKNIQESIVQHEDDIGGRFKRVLVNEIQTIQNEGSSENYLHKQRVLMREHGVVNAKSLYHGTMNWKSVVDYGIDVRFAQMTGMFGAGAYFAENFSKSNLYAYGPPGSGCPLHRDPSCYSCPRKVLICDVGLGKAFFPSESYRRPHAPPGHNSIIGEPSVNLRYREFVVYDGEQVLPTHLVTYTLVDPDA